jgi:hypothetical protein
MSKNNHSHRAWIVTVDMGYGHQRASYPLRKFAQGDVITANSYQGIPNKDKSLWVNSRKFYEFISRFKKVPFFGSKAFELFDKLQRIPRFYPRRDLSKSNIQLKQVYKFFEDDWGKHLIDRLSKKKLPLVSPFYVTAMMAEYHNYKGDIYCMLCDADISRTWVPPNPRTSRINYLAPNKRVVERLKLYGVRPEKVYLTGFPLPDENVGNDLKTLKADIGKRLINLDPEKVYISQYKHTLQRHLGRGNLKITSVRPLTITFAVGGAGAQRELGIEILKSLKERVINGEVSMNLIAGTHETVKRYFRSATRELGLSKFLDKSIKIIYQKDKQEYFKAFNRVLRTTDILWTKPSELTFYSALGIPIIMAPPIGSQEMFNRRWLLSIGAGINQEDPRYTNEWLFDWLKSGWLAEAAMQGFMEAPKYGTYNVEKIIFHELEKTKEIKTVLQY